MKQNRRRFIATTALLGTGLAASAIPQINSQERKMLVHHVFFWLKNPSSKEDLNKLIAGLKTLGGRAPEYLRNHKPLLEIVREFHKQGKWVFAICHGIQILVTAGLTNKNRITAYEHVRSEIEMGGGTYCTEQAIRDKNIVTGQTWQSHPDFYREVFKCLREK